MDCVFTLIERESPIGNVTTIGIDLAKSVFSVHGVDALGHEVLRRTPRRHQLSAFIAQQLLVRRGNHD